MSTFNRHGQVFRSCWRIGLSAADSWRAYEKRVACGLASVPRLAVTCFHSSLWVPADSSALVYSVWVCWRRHYFASVLQSSSGGASIASTTAQQQDTRVYDSTATYPTRPTTCQVAHSSSAFRFFVWHIGPPWMTRASRRRQDAV
jgi:hypothetical protein